MANHGYCKNCWWWDNILPPNDHQNVGICYMQTLYSDSPRETLGLDYCPDYYNRKKGDKKQTLKEWVEKGSKN